jgi:hypothetical protein
VDREGLLRRLDRAWCSLLDVYAGVPNSELTEPGTDGGWSIKDTISHVTAWEEESLEHLPTILAGMRTPRYSVKYGGIDAFNALTLERSRGLTVAEVLSGRDETHQRLVEYLVAVPEDAFATETRFRHRLRADTWGHYPGHAEAIRRRRGGRPEGR